MRRRNELLWVWQRRPLEKTKKKKTQTAAEEEAGAFQHKGKSSAFRAAETMIKQSENYDRIAPAE